MQSNAAFMAELAAQSLTGYPTDTPAEWCSKNLVFDEADNHGPFRIVGREYVVEPLNTFADRRVKDYASVWGSQTGKTGVMMGGVAWCIVNDPCGILWVMPGSDLAQSFSRDRWQPLLEASEELRIRIPVGRDRHYYKTLSQSIGAALVTFIGTHSEANLASRPARRVILDEVDKFKLAGMREDAALMLAEQRTKDKVDPQRIKSSTPTTTDGGIWLEYLKGDQRRYHVPCPHCGKLVVFAWSKDYTVLPKIGCESYVVWDKEADLKDGKWDLERAAASVRIECCHCGGHILNHHKTKMIRDGQWVATASTGSKSYRSTHLSSIYSTSAECSLQTLVVKFLTARMSTMGMHSFVNGDLAEPWEQQGDVEEMGELISPENAEPLKDAIPLMTVDCQANRPNFWVTIRSWDPFGNSRLVAAYNCDDYETLQAIQHANGVLDHRVCIDSGWNNRSILDECLRHGQRVKHGSKWIGWTPSKGFPKGKMFRHERTKTMRPYSLKVPDADMHKRNGLMLLEFNSDRMMEILDNFRKGKSAFKYEITSLPAGPEVYGAERTDQETYLKHCSAKKLVKDEFGGKKVEWVYKTLKRKPDHTNDCEIMQIPWAIVHKRLPWNIRPGAPVEPAAAN